MLAAAAAAFVLTSPAFAPGSAMPVRYTCDGSNTSPPLHWTMPPAGTESLALRVVDLDTKPHFVHWSVSGIPAATRALGAGTHLGKAAQNTFGQAGYGGPCPPPGQTHRYVFTLQARDAAGKPLAQAKLLVTYHRR